MARALSAWRDAKPLWQRRAACVAFVNLARHGGRAVPGLPATILANAAALARDPSRFAQTGVGWVLRELSLHDPAAVVRFAERNLASLSREAIRSLAEKMPPGERRRLFRLHADAARGSPPRT
jgi:3-methyladenine DNA glycosylase AlkD